jgi:FHA domain
MTGAIIVLVLRIALAAVLYVFVGWAFYTLWRDLNQQSQTLASHRIPPLSLKVQGEDEIQPRYFSIPELIIGRDPQCDFNIQDDTVSARHSRLSYHHHQWWIEDMHSTNGTYLNQERLTTPTVMITGDELRCGQVTMTVAVGENIQD